MKISDVHFGANYQPSWHEPRLKLTHAGEHAPFVVVDVTPRLGRIMRRTLRRLRRHSVEL